MKSDLIKDSSHWVIDTLSKQWYLKILKKNIIKNNKNTRKKHDLKKLILLGMVILLQRGQQVDPVNHLGFNNHDL